MNTTEQERNKIKKCIVVTFVLAIITLFGSVPSESYIGLAVGNLFLGIFVALYIIHKRNVNSLLLKQEPKLSIQQQSNIQKL